METSTALLKFWRKVQELKRQRVTHTIGVNPIKRGFIRVQSQQRARVLLSRAILSLGERVRRKSSARTDMPLIVTNGRSLSSPAASRELKFI